MRFRLVKSSEGYNPTGKGATLNVETLEELIEFLQSQPYNLILRPDIMAGKFVVEIYDDYREPQNVDKMMSPPASQNFTPHT